jgi:hypothetical protein
MSANAVSVNAMSANAMSALRPGEAGAYVELVKRPLPEGLVLLCIPSLAGMLFGAQNENSAALTEDEVLSIRDRMGVMVMRHDDARAMEEKRGYVDIDPADAWQGWLRLQEDQA